MVRIIKLIAIIIALSIFLVAYGDYKEKQWDINNKAEIKQIESAPLVNGRGYDPEEVLEWKYGES